MKMEKKMNDKFWKEVKRHASNWRWKKLEENFKDGEEPVGIIETIDAFVWGTQNKYQKQISNSGRRIYC